MVRIDWNKEEIKEIYDTPLLKLIFRAASVHIQYHEPGEVQLCTLLSIKTGGCTEDCAYCPQAARYQTGVSAQRLLDKQVVLDAAKKAKEFGSSRFCMGAAWRQVRDGGDFEKVLDMVKEIDSLGMEVCCTLGMLTENQAKRLKEAGVYAYNHNLDTSESYYDKIITTRTYQERLDTIQKVRESGMTVCCGGIIGMGESEQDRIDLIHTLATMPLHPESVTINALLPIPGTPLGEQTPVAIWELARMIATARITMPKAMVRLSAGRVTYSSVEQTLCFLAGANSIHTGEKLLTTTNFAPDKDEELIELLGIIPKAANTSKNCM